MSLTSTVILPLVVLPIMAGSLVAPIAPTLHAARVERMSPAVKIFMI